MINTDSPSSYLEYEEILSGTGQAVQYGIKVFDETILRKVWKIEVAVILELLCAAIISDYWMQHLVEDDITNFIENNHILKSFFSGIVWILVGDEKLY